MTVNASKRYSIIYKENIVELVDELLPPPLKAGVPHSACFYSVRGDGYMLMRVCPICGKVHKQGQSCPKAKERNGEYDKEHRNPRKRMFYHSKRWHKMRDAVKARFNGLDAYQFIVNHVMIPGNTIHHIIPLSDDPSKAMDINNLILLSEATHNLIHAKYKTKEKKNVQKFLKIIVDEWDKF